MNRVDPLAHVNTSGHGNPELNYSPVSQTLGYKNTLRLEKQLKGLEYVLLLQKTQVQFPTPTSGTPPITLGTPAGSCTHIHIDIHITFV